MMGKPTETADLSWWELTDSGLTAGDLLRTKLGLLNMGDSCVAEVVGGATGSEPGFFPST